MSRIYAGDFDDSGGMIWMMKSKNSSTFPMKGLFSLILRILKPSPFSRPYSAMLVFPMAILYEYQLVNSKLTHVRS